MKKLMTMLAAAAMAFGLYAALPDTWKASEKTAETWQDGKWFGVTSDNATFETGALGLKTGSGTVSRCAVTNDDGSAQVFSCTSNVYFDVNVDLLGQALTELPTVEQLAGAKLSLFVLDNSEDCGLPPTGTPETALYALAGNTDAASDWALYKLGCDIEALTNGTKRLTINAYNDVLAGDDARAGFMVYLNGGTTVGTIDALNVLAVYHVTKPETGSITTDWADKLIDAKYLGADFAPTVAVSDFYKGKRLLLSLATGLASQTFKDIAFAGNAKVAAVEFTETAYDFIPSDLTAMMAKTGADVTLSCDDETAYDATTGAITKGCTLTAAYTGSSIDTPVFVSDNAKAVVTGNQIAVTFEGGAEFTISAQQAAATVDDVAYATIAKAIEAANTAAASAPVMFVLSQDVAGGDDGIVFAGTQTITLDLAGKKIELAELTSLSTTGLLEIIDSSNDKTGRIIGEVDGTGVTIKGGSFDKDSNSTEADPPAFTLADNVADGFTVGEKTIEAVDFWTVKEAEKYTVTIVPDETTTLTVKVGDVPVTTGDFEEGTVLTLEVAPKEGYENAQILVDGVQHAEATLTVEKAVTISSTATLKSYDVSFWKDQKDGEKVGETIKVNHGELAVAPEAPTKTGYTFTDWDPSTNVAITAATDFVAKWQINKYTLTIPNDVEATAVVSNSVGQIDDLTAIEYNTEVKVYWTAKAGYKITAGETETIVMDAAKTAAKPTVEQDAPAPDPIEPGKQEVIPAGDDAEAKAAARVAEINNAKEANIALTDAQKALDGTAKKAYFDHVEAKATPNGAGGYTIELDVVDDVGGTVQASANAAAAETIANLTATSATIEDAIPGLYYSVVYGSTVSLGAEGDRTMATAEGVTITLPERDPAAQFYKVVVHAGPKVSN